MRHTITFRASSKHPYKINFKPVVLIVSITIIMVGLGILLDGQIVPDVPKLLLTDDAVKKDKAKSSGSTVEEAQVAQEENSKGSSEETQKLPGSSHLEQVNQAANATIEKAESLIAETDQLIAKAGLSMPRQEAPLKINKDLSKRLAKARKKLDALGQ